MKTKGFFILLLVFTTACFTWWVIQLLRLNKDKLMVQERAAYHQVEQAQNQIVWLSKREKDNIGPIRIGSQILFLSQENWEQTKTRFPHLSFSIEEDIVQISPQKSYLTQIHEKGRDNLIRLISESSFFFILLFTGFVWIYRGLNETIKLSERQNDFLVSVTHELKTPIATSRLLFETLRRYTLPKEEYENLTESGIKSTEQQLELVESLLLASHLENKSYVFPQNHVQLSAWLHKECATLETEYAGRISLKTHIEEDISGTIEENSFRMSLRNLISNAAKYGGTGTQVDVSLTKTNSGILLQVADDGPGIPEQIRSKIFEKFYRSEEAHSQAKQGTGLGLFIVAETIRRLKGKVWVEARDPRGSMFNLLIESL